MTLDDPAVLNRHAAYIDTLRGQFRRERQAGFILVGVGLFMLAFDWLNGALQPRPVIAAVIVLAVGWAALLYAVIQRGRWAAAHPFDPNV
jgi:hypothetical protein